MVMKTAATEGVWANLKQSSDTPGPMKPMDCPKHKYGTKMWCCCYLHDLPNKCNRETRFDQEICRSSCDVTRQSHDCPRYGAEPCSLFQVDIINLLSDSSQ
uniref:Uncharacterized protein n=1 Tax=Oryza brachyantha TaxID=4533 RepID=J3M7R7_ORYBR